MSILLSQIERKLIKSTYCLLLYVDPYITFAPLFEQEQTIPLVAVKSIELKEFS
jgi:hypothetical protein